MASRICLLWCWIVLCGTSASAHLPIDPPPAEIAVQAFDCQREEAVHDLQIDLIVDDSSSMAGFLRVAGGDYRKLVSDLTDLGVTPPVKIRPLNRPGVILQSTAPLFTEDFYGRFHTTPLQNAFEKVPQDPTNIVTVLVSDLVQSKKGADPRDAIRALSRALECAPYAMVMGLTAPYYERGRIENRHFYLVALAHDQRYLRKFVTTTKVDRLADHRTIEEIRDGIGEGPTLFYSMAPMLSALKIEVVAQHGREWSPADRETTIDCYGGLFRTPFAAFATSARRQSRIPPLLLGIHARVDATITGNAQIRADVESVRVPTPVLHRTTGGSRVISPGSIAPLVGNGRRRWLNLRVEGEIPRDTNQWRFCRVRLYVTNGRVNPPWWVERWSAEEPPKDGTLAVKGIVNKIIEDVAVESLLTEFWIGLTYEQLK